MYIQTEKPTHTSTTADAPLRSEARTAKALQTRATNQRTTHEHLGPLPRRRTVNKQVKGG